VIWSASWVSAGLAVAAEGEATGPGAADRTGEGTATGEAGLGAAIAGVAAATEGTAEGETGDATAEAAADGRGLTTTSGLGLGTAAARF
jgi:hypothetical protein